MLKNKLAIDGGLLIRNQALSPWPVFAEDEINAVEKVLRSGKVNYWTGAEGRAFEKEFAEYVGCKYAVAVANGSVALELALQALGVGPEDEVVITPRSFIASASSIVMRGAKPVFADVDSNSGNISTKTIKKVLSPKTKAIICVHLSGWACDMDPMLKLAETHGINVIEDCAQAHGAFYYSESRGLKTQENEENKIIKNEKTLYPRPAGSIGHVGCFSFCQDKIMTTGGEGGMLVTNDRRK